WRSSRSRSRVRKAARTGQNAGVGRQDATARRAVIKFKPIRLTGHSRLLTYPWLHWGSAGGASRRMKASKAIEVDRADAGQLKDLLALHEAALSSMSHGLSMVDAEQRLVVVNQRFLEMYDLSAEVARAGMPMADLIRHSAERGNFPIAQLEEIKRRRLAMMARGKPFRLLRQMSRGRTFAMDYRPLASGGWVTLVEDVTERQRREYELRVQVERYHQAIAAMSHGLCAVDADHRVVLFNERLVEMYGLSEDIIRPGVSMRDGIEIGGARGYFPEATPEQVWQNRLEKMAAGKPFRQRQRLRNGRQFVLHYHPMPDGGWVTLAEDVTARNRMERELRVQYERFDQAINHMSHGLSMFGPDERLIVCNAQYLKIYGLDPAVAKPGISSRDLLALWVESLDGPDMTVDALYEKRKRASAGGVLSTMRLRLKDGRVIEATTRPTPDGGWVTAHEDVTDRIGYEKALREQNILLDATLDNMSHGLCVFDKDWRVIVRNRRYLDLYGLGPNDAQPGTPLLEMMRQSIDRGLHSAKSAENFFADFIKRVTVDREPVVHRRLTNGRPVRLAPEAV